MRPTEKQQDGPIRVKMVSALSYCICEL